MGHICRSLALRSFKRIQTRSSIVYEQPVDAAVQSLFNECNSVSETIRHQLIRMTASIYVYSMGAQIHNLWDTELLDILNQIISGTVQCRQPLLSSRYLNSVVCKLKPTDTTSKCTGMDILMLPCFTPPNIGTQGINGEYLDNPKGG